MHPAGRSSRRQRPASPLRRAQSPVQIPIARRRYPAVQPSSFLGHPPPGTADLVAPGGSPRNLKEFGPYLPPLRRGGRAKRHNRSKADLLRGHPGRRRDLVRGRGHRTGCCRRRPTRHLGAPGVMAAGRMLGRDGGLDLRRGGRRLGGQQPSHQARQDDASDDDDNNRFGGHALGPGHDDDQGDPAVGRPSTGCDVSLYLPCATVGGRVRIP